MSFGLNSVTANRATTTTYSKRRPQLQGSGPWANLGAPLWAPSPLFTGGLGQKSFLFGASPETGYLWYRGTSSGNSQAYQLFKMLPILTRSGGGGAATLVRDTTSTSYGNLDNDECSTQQALTQDASEDLPLDFSSSGQFGGQEGAVAIQTQEVKSTWNPQTCEASAPPSSEGVHPMDLSSQTGDSGTSEKVGNRNPCADPDPKPAMQVEDLKAEIGKLQEKLERSREDFNKRVLQMEKYSREETTALLKAICWKGQLHMEYDDLPIRHIPVRMKSMLYWDEDFRGQGSLVRKFRENLSGKRDRDCVSIKQKWNRIIKTLAKKPHEFFQKHAHVHKIDDDEKMFLIKLAKVCCVFKGIDPSKQQQPMASAFQPRTSGSVPPSPPPPSSTGNTFLDDHDKFPNGWRDMPVFTSSQFSRSRLN